MRIHFLYCPDFLWIGPKIMTPKIPLMTGLPPTAPTASGKLSSNHGWIKKERVIVKALKIPK